MAGNIEMEVIEAWNTTRTCVKQSTTIDRVKKPCEHIGNARAWNYTPFVAPPILMLLCGFPFPHVLNAIFSHNLYI